MTTQSFDFSFQVGGGQVGRPMYWRDKPAFCFFFLKRKWGVPFCLLFLKEVISLERFKY